MSSHFTDEDVRILAKSVNLRERLMDALTVTLPSKPSDVMALVSVVESLDKTILAKAKLEIENTDAKNNEETKLIMRDLLLNLHKSNNVPVAINEDNRQYLPDAIEYDISSGETLQFIDSVTIKDFTP